MKKNFFMENLKEVLSLIVQQNPKLTKDVKNSTIYNIYKEKDDKLLKFVLTGDPNVKMIEESTVRKIFNGFDDKIVDAVIFEIKQVIPLREESEYEQYQKIKKALNNIDQKDMGGDVAHVALSFLPLFHTIMRSYHGGKIIGRLINKWLFSKDLPPQVLDANLLIRGAKLEKDIETYKTLEDGLARAKDNLKKEQLRAELAVAKKRLQKWIALGRILEAKIKKDQDRIEKLLSKTTNLSDKEKKEIAKATTAVSAVAKKFADEKGRKATVDLVKTGMRKLSHDTMYYLRKLGDRSGATGIAKQITGGSGQSVRNVGGIAALTLATLLLYGANKLYKNFLSKAARACADKTGNLKEKCMEQYRNKAKQLQKADLMKAMVACKQANDPEKCKRIVSAKIKKLDV